MTHNRLREFLNVSVESAEEPPRREEYKGWLILRFNPGKDDLSLVDQDRLDDWKGSKRLLIVLERDEQETLTNEEQEQYDRLTEALSEIEIPFFKNEEELGEYIEREHLPEGGEV